jgi:predicted transposase YdaD
LTKYLLFESWQHLLDFMIDDSPGSLAQNTSWFFEFGIAAEQRGELKGRQEGEQTGILKGEQALILRLLTRRIGSVAPEMRSQVQALSLTQLESLGEALLDFAEVGETFPTAIKPKNKTRRRRANSHRASAKQIAPTTAK